MFLPHPSIQRVLVPMCQNGWGGGSSLSAERFGEEAAHVGLRSGADADGSTDGCREDAGERHFL